MKIRVPLLFIPAMALAIGLPIQSLAQQPEPEYETRVYKVKWRSAEDLTQILHGFDIGVSSSRSFNTLTVTATLAQHNVVTELLRKYDVSARSIELQFYLLKATTQDGGLRNGVPEEVRKVIEEVGALTKYKSFELVDAPILRALEGKRATISGEGAIPYTVRMGHNSIIDTGKGLQIRVDPFSVSFKFMKGYSSASTVKESSGGEGLLETGSKAAPPQYVETTTTGIETAFTIADGETIVLGASKLEGGGESDSWAVISVVTAKII